MQQEIQLEMVPEVVAILVLLFVEEMVIDDGDRHRANQSHEASNPNSFRFGWLCLGASGRELSSCRQNWKAMDCRMGKYPEGNQKCNIALVKMEQNVERKG